MHKEPLSWLSPFLNHVQLLSIEIDIYKALKYFFKTIKQFRIPEAKEVILLTNGRQFQERQKQDRQGLHGCQKKNMTN